MQILYKLRSFLSTCSMLNITVFFQIPTLAPPLFFFFSPVIEAYVMGEARDTQNIICHNLWCVMVSFLTKLLRVIWYFMLPIILWPNIPFFFNTNGFKCSFFCFVLLVKHYRGVSKHYWNDILFMTWLPFCRDIGVYLVWRILSWILLL